MDKLREDYGDCVESIFVGPGKSFSPISQQSEDQLKRKLIIKVLEMQVNVRENDQQQPSSWYDCDGDDHDSRMEYHRRGQAKTRKWLFCASYNQNYCCTDNPTSSVATRKAAARELTTRRVLIIPVLRRMFAIVDLVDVVLRMLRARSSCWLSVVRVVRMRLQLFL